MAQSGAEALTAFDSDQVAAATVALIDGLLLHLLTDPTGLTSQAALAIVDAHLRHCLNIDDVPTGDNRTGES